MPLTTRSRQGMAPSTHDLYVILPGCPGTVFRPDAPSLMAGGTIP